MTRLPAAPKDIGAALDLPQYELPPECSNPFCGNLAWQHHHITRRSHVGRGADAWWVEIKGVPRPNVVALCNECHERVTLGESWIKLVGDEYVWRESGVSEFLEPHPPLTPGEPEGESTERTAEAAFATEPASSPSTPAPGETCPVCDRRVPHKHKPSTPKSKPFAFRIPFDEHDQFVEILDSAAAHWGVKEVPYHRYRLLLDALVLVLQTNPSKEKDDGDRSSDRGAADAALPGGVTGG